MSSDTPAAALVVGGTGGIGAALLAELRSRKRYQHLVSASRRAGEAASKTASELRIDIEDEPSIEIAAGELSTRLDGEGVELRGIYICTGILHGAPIAPERRLMEIQPEAFERVMRINALGPLLVAKHFSPLLPPKAPTRLAAISARVGSITDNRLGGWTAYRCSKAALNMGFANVAVELRRTHPGCVVTLFHPGTVATALSEPFRSNVPVEKLFAPDRAARQFCDVLDRRDTGEVPRFVDWAGAAVEY